MNNIYRENTDKFIDFKVGNVIEKLIVPSQINHKR